MNETPLHEPLIAEEGKEKERVFTGTPERIVNICLASISALIIYWTVYVSADVMWKHGLYIMTVFCMTLVIYPFEKKPKVNHVSLVDWLLIIGSIAGSAYAIWEYLDRFMRLGMLTEMDIFFGCLMLFLGLEVGRRVIGWSLTLVSIVLILYSLYGFVIPGHFGHGGFDLEAVVTQVYAGMEGYYGLSAKMMIQYVAPFILMGAFLEKSGAGDFFIRLAFALTRNTVGGPAKAAVIGSALLGSISGSAVANVVGTGTFTIPLMKKIGYRAEFAGATEAVASSGGQFMPPIMGASAFLIAEIVGIPYWTVAACAAVPAILYYLAVFFVVDFEAAKTGLTGMNKAELPRTRDVLKKGWPSLVSPVVLIVLLAGLQWSPAKAAVWSIAVAFVICMIHKDTRMNIHQIIDTLREGAIGALETSVACAAVGIVVGSITLTGLALKLSSLLITASGGNLVILMVLTMIACVIMGMGLPTVACYVVLASMVAPALIKMDVVPIAAHLFIFYFGIISAITPPVALASMVGAGIAKADFVKTSLQALKLGLAAFILPFMFVLNPALVLQGDILEILQCIFTAVVGILSMSITLQGFFLEKTPIWQRVIFGVAAITLIIPETITDIIGLAIFIVAVLLQVATRKKKKAALA